MGGRAAQRAGRYGSIDTNGADFLAASELHLAGLSEVRTG